MFRPGNAKYDTVLDATIERNAVSFHHSSNGQVEIEEAEDLLPCLSMAFFPSFLSTLPLFVEPITSPATSSQHTPDMGLKRLLRSKRGKTLPSSSSEPSAVTTRGGTSSSSSSKSSRERALSSSSGQPPLVTASTIVFSIPGLRDEIFAYHAYELMKSYWRLTRPGLPVTRLALLRAHLELWHVEEEERLREECFLARWWPMPRPRDSTHEQLFSLSKQQVSQDPHDKYKRKAARISTYSGPRRYQQWRKEWKLEIRIEPAEEDTWCMNVWREHCRRQRQELLLRERPHAHRADLDEVVA